MIIVSVFTLLSMLSPQDSGLPSGWIIILKQGFGWGMLVVPLSILAGGLWLVLRSFGDRLPSIKLDQIIGAGLLYFAFLTVRMES